jgi:hypothetical protein
MTREWLEAEYIGKGRSFNAICAELGIGRSALWRLLAKFGLRKVKAERTIKVEWLRQRYVVDLAPVEVIAEEAGCSVDTIKSWASIWKLERGQSFKRSREGRKRYSMPHTEAAKSKMSLSKTRPHEGYSRGKFMGHYERRYIHRIIAAECIGRELLDSEIVHHVDCDKANHHPLNLLVIERSAHQALHIVMRRLPDLNQVAWLRANGFSVEVVGDGDYQSSPAFVEWYGPEGRGRPLE